MQFMTFEPQSYVAQGDHVVGIGNYGGTVKPTGRAFKADFVMVFTFKGNKVVRFQEYTDTAVLAQAYDIAEAA
jgi:ketosteroid isomerase-like protein